MNRNQAPKPENIYNPWRTVALLMTLAAALLAISFVFSLVRAPESDKATPENVKATQQEILKWIEEAGDR